jgi:hypothetical protein
MAIPTDPSMPAPEATAEPQIPQAGEPKLPKQAPYRQKPISFENDDEEILFGPTSRPDVKLGSKLVSAKPPLPGGIEKYFDLVAEASRDPNAPRELHDFVRILAYNIGRGA